MDRLAQPMSASAPDHRGVRLIEGGADFCVYSRNADRIWVCLFDESGEKELARWRLAGRTRDLHFGFVPSVREGTLYGLRADGPWQPEKGHLFDPAKLLVDPYATRIDRAFIYSQELCLPRDRATDTAAFVPRGIIMPEEPSVSQSSYRKPGFIYEVAVKAFTKLHPDIHIEKRGTLAGLSHPKIIEHLVRLGVTHVELMPVTAWIDERHLPPLGLSNAWGYNPVCYMALDPRLAPEGLSELRQATDALHQAGIRTLLDVVFNHTGESDLRGPTLSLRGLDHAEYYRAVRDNPAVLVNDTGCGNTLACDREPVIRLVMDSLRHFVRHAGIDGYRFDLATVLGRSDHGFDPAAPLLRAIETDSELKDKVLIAEPWDIGPGGYQAGAFAKRWHEWNDRYRDDVRRFWRGDAGILGTLATRLAGSSDVFSHGRMGPSTGINFLAAHDGFSLRDLVSHEHRHNHANGEENRDGHGENYSWNCGVEGETDNEDVNSRRERDIRALLTTLFFSLGTPMLTAGDEFGRTQGGNNNAYAQDNDTTWLDWGSANLALANLVGSLAKFRSSLEEDFFSSFLRSCADEGGNGAVASWLGVNGRSLAPEDWYDGDTLGVMIEGGKLSRKHCFLFNRSHQSIVHTLPVGEAWRPVFCSCEEPIRDLPLGKFLLPGRSVTAFASLED